MTEIDKKTRKKTNLPKIPRCGIIAIYLRRGVFMELFMVVYILIFIIFALVAFAVMQIKMAGLKVRDFMSFIEANQMLDKLYIFAQRYQRLSTMEQLMFLTEAEKVFDAFDKVPEMLWEEEYQKYMEVLNTYKDIKMVRWASN